MKRVVLAASAISLLGCGSSLAPVASAPPAQIRAAQPIEVALPVAPPQQAKAARMREPGDYVVYRFSGSYREAPLTLTQQVVGHFNGYLLVDTSVDDEGTQLRLRLRFATEGERKGDLVSVARFQGDVQVPFGVVAYGKLMDDIMLRADENAGLVDATRMPVDLGGEEIYCDVSTYRVRVGAHDATMTTVSSDEFGWGHVGGEIATSDGRVLYKAEIVDIGSRGAGRVATQEDIEIYEDDYEHFEE